MAKMGPGLRYTYGGKLTISGDGVTIPIAQTCLNKINFPNLDFSDNFRRGFNFINNVGCLNTNAFIRLSVLNSSNL